MKFSAPPPPTIRTCGGFSRTFALLVPTDQPVARRPHDDVECVAGFDRKIFASPLLVGECWGDCCLVQHLYVPLILPDIHSVNLFASMTERMYRWTMEHEDKTS